MKALITGITGFMGCHLAEYLLSQGVQVEGITRHISGGFIPKNIAGIKDKIKIYSEIYISSTDSIQIFFQEFNDYDYIFHLASDRFLSPAWIHNTNVIGTANLLEAVHNSERKSGHHPVIVIAGCAEMYGIPPVVEERDDRYGFMAPDDTQPLKSKHKMHKHFKFPITEDFPPNPVSSYAVSKAAQDMLGFQYHKEYGMKIVRARLFDITGPRCHQSLLPSGIAKQIVIIEKGSLPREIKIASPEYSRDYTDVRDAARALWLAATKCKYGEAYNICSGRGRTVQQVIDTLRMQSTAQVEIIQDKSLMHPNDIIALVGACTKFCKRTGWKPEIGFAQSMGDMLEWWRRKI